MSGKDVGNVFDSFPWDLNERQAKFYIHGLFVQVISLSLSFNLLIKLFEFIVALAPFSMLKDGVGDVASDVIGSYLLLSVVVVDTVWSL